MEWLEAETTCEFCGGHIGYPLPFTLSVSHSLSPLVFSLLVRVPAWDQHYSVNMETWPTTLSEVAGEQGPPADWNSSLTFSQHHPLLTPQLTSTSAPLLVEQKGRDSPFNSVFSSFYHFLPGYTLAPGNYHLISLMRWGKYCYPESL